jgi:hypothetical protein
MLDLQTPLSFQGEPRLSVEFAIWYLHLFKFPG